MDTIVFHPRSFLQSPSYSTLSKSKLGRLSFSPKEIADRPSLFTSWSNHLQLTVSSNRADGNHTGRTVRKSVETGKSAYENEEEKPRDRRVRSSNTDEIIALFRRLQASIANEKSSDGNHTGRTAWRSPETGRSVNENEKEKPRSSDGTVHSSSSDAINALLRRLQASAANQESTTSKKISSNSSKKRSSHSSKEKPLAESISDVLNHSRKQLEGKASNKKIDKLLTGWRGDLSEVEKIFSPTTAENRLTRPPSNFVKRSPITPRPVPKVKAQVKSEESSPVAPEVIENIENMKLPALKELAKSRGIPGYYKLKKRELLELLRA